MKQVQSAFLFVFCTFLSGHIFAQTAGIWRGSLDVTIDGNTVNYKNGVGTGTDLQGAGLGSITPATTFTLSNPYLFSFKNGACDVTGGSLRWRVYKQGSTPGPYTTINFGFQCNCTTAPGSCGGCWLCSVSDCNSGNNDQQWGTAVNVDLKAAALAADGSVGTYVLDVDWNINTQGANCSPNPGTAASSATFEVTSALPVEFVSFRARPMGQLVRLDWETATERDNHYFEVQHSRDMEEWSVVGTVMATRGSMARKDYSFSHRPAVSGIHYYRLRQIDAQGSFAYTPVRNALLEGRNHPTLHPNPVTGSSVRLHLNAASSGMAYIRLMDATGRLVRSWEIAAESGQITELDLTGINEGLFFVDINGQNTVKMAVERQ